MMKQFFLLTVCGVGLAACGGIGLLQPKSKVPNVPIVMPLDPTVVLPPPVGANTAATLDTTTEAQRAAAVSAPVLGARELGKATVALGSPAEPGFWLRTPLARAPGKGKVVTASGASVAVDLQPGTGGALLSLAAYRALGLSLTDLPEVTVFAE
jgi:hypothetical protein